MRDIHNFAFDAGGADLILSGIPWTKTAYVLVSWVRDLPALLAECRTFCHMAGAEKIYVSGVELPEPPAFRILTYQGPLPEPSEEAFLWPLTEETLPDFLAVYNRAMAGVHGARLFRGTEGNQLLSMGGCFFVHRDRTLLGLGQVADGVLLSIVSCVPGAGSTVMKALLSAAFTDSVSLRVADDNPKALHLYEKMGFYPTGIAETWWELRKGAF